MLGGAALLGAAGALMGPLVVRLCVEALAILAERQRAVLPDSNEARKRWAIVRMASDRATRSRASLGLPRVHGHAREGSVTAFDPRYELSLAELG